MRYWDSFKQDLYFSLRIVRKRPGYTFFAVVLLALIIGVNGAVFSIIQGVLLRPLPFPGADRLVAIWESNPGQGRARDPVSFPDFASWREQAKSLSGIAAMRATLVEVSSGNRKSEARAGIVSDGIFSVLAVHPLIGRTFQTGDDTPGGPMLTAISESFWASRFNRDRNVIGQQIAVDDALFTIVGVVPDSDLPSLGRPDLWLPMFAGYRRETANLNNRSYRFLAVIGRTAAKASEQQAQAELNTISASLAKQFPATNAGEGAAVLSLRDQVTGTVRDPLLALCAAVALLLLLGCANIASLITARALARRREVAVRLALGCSRGRLISQLLVENGLVAFAGGACGAVLTYYLLALLAKLGPKTLPRLAEVRLDASTCLFIIALCSLMTVFFGLAPALVARGAQAPESLKDNRQGAVGGRSNRSITFVLMGGETVLSLILLIGAGLAVRSFLALSSVRLGFSPEGVVTANLVPYSSRDSAKLSITYDEIVARLMSSPDVAAAGASQALPLSASTWVTSFQITDKPAGPSPTIANYGRVAGDYFGAMRIGLVQGRYLNSGDRLNSPHVAVVNEAFVARYFQRENPIGKQLAIWDSDAPYEIVGVVTNTTQRRLEVSPDPAFYIPYAQHPEGSMALVVRAKGDPAALSGLIRREVAAVAPSMRILAQTTFDNLLSSYLAGARYSSLLLTAFAIFAACIAGLGIYAITSHRVVQRRPEIGVRMALGAAPASVVRLVIFECISVTGCAIAAGMGLAALLSRFMGGLLYGVPPIDPITFIAAPALILIVSA
ncbi:MAG TPA: ABC transporter permease, partial [Blastocatellia bacterium]|nr:ABC transporter permease [Blastocatellia bacterium]